MSKYGTISEQSLREIGRVCQCLVSEMLQVIKILLGIHIWPRTRLNQHVPNRDVIIYKVEWRLR